MVAHFHLIMGVAAIFGMFAGLYFWFPKMFGRFLNEGIGKVHFWLTFIGVYAIFMPMHFLGPRRAPEALLRYDGGGISAETAARARVHQHCGVHHDWRAADFLFNLFYSLLAGKEAKEENPWHATTLNGHFVAASV